MTGIRAQCFKSKKNVIGRIEGVDGGQKALDSVELMLLVVVNHLAEVPRTKFKSVKRMVYTLNCSAKSLASRCDNSFGINIFTLRS